MTHELVRYAVIAIIAAALLWGFYQLGWKGSHKPSGRDPFGGSGW